MLGMGYPDCVLKTVRQYRLIKEAVSGVSNGPSSAWHIHNNIHTAKEATMKTRTMNPFLSITVAGTVTALCGLMGSGAAMAATSSPTVSTSGSGSAPTSTAPSPDVATDKKAISAILAKLKGEKTLVASLKSQIAKEVANQKVFASDISKNVSDIKSDSPASSSSSTTSPGTSGTTTTTAKAGSGSSSTSTSSTSSTTGKSTRVAKTGSGSSSSSSAPSTTTGTSATATASSKDLASDKKDLAADRKLESQSRITLLRERLALQKALILEDKYRDMLRAYRVELKADLSKAPSTDKNAPGDLASDKKTIKMLVAEVAKDRKTLSGDLAAMKDSDDISSSKASSEKSAIKSLRTKLSSAVKSLRIARMDLRRDETSRHAPAASSHSHGSSGTHSAVPHHVDKK